MPEKYTPRTGDRVRVTQEFEGVVEDLPHHNYFKVVTDNGERHDFEYDEIGEDSPLAHHFELLEAAEIPLPTTPSSVVHYRYDDTEKYVRVSGDTWYAVQDGYTTTRLLRPSLYVVEFDAGAQ